MRWRVFYIIAALMFACILPSCERSHDAVPPADQLNVVTAEQASTAMMTLSDAITVRCTDKDGVVLIVFECGGRHITVTVERDATMYCFARMPTFVAVHDRYASNEDRFLFYNLAMPDPQPATVEHSDLSSYTHSHFAVKGGRNGQMTVEEVQYAGDEPSRVRELLVPMKAPAERTAGNWRALSHD